MMPCPERVFERVFVYFHDLHNNPAAFQNMANATHLSDAEKRDGRQMQPRTYVAEDSREALEDALRRLDAKEQS
ncbi:MAG: hypothetical protein AAF125_05655 [Chloroflexota bacterium]